MTDYSYPGAELDLFAAAHRWKAYLRSSMEPYLRGEVLEVGAGIGGTTRALAPASATRWTCLEPDGEMVERLRRKVREDDLPADEVVAGTLDDVRGRSFDTILYVDVLEHIQDDREEVERAATLLRRRGHLVALSPAHGWLFSEFDEAVGHYRRYDSESLRRLSPPGLEIVRLRYLDAAGLLASMANRLLLRQSVPTRRQVRFWDRVLVPASRALDPMLRYRVGKSVLAVWRVTNASPGSRRSGSRSDSAAGS